MTFEKVSLVVLVASFTLFAAILDFRTRRLPNWLTVTGFVLGVLYQSVVGAWTGGLTGAGQGFLFSLAGFATGFGVLLVLFLIGGGGAGDVKLMGALGAWLGPQTTVVVFVVSTALILVLSIASLTTRIARHGLGPMFRRPTSQTSTIGGLSKSKAKPARGMLPFGVPVAVATWAVLILQAFHKTP